jgi:hypothetical protein
MITELTPDQLVSDIRQLGPQEFHVILHYLADRVQEARLRDGRRILDQIDFEQWLKECAEVAKHA